MLEIAVNYIIEHAARQGRTITYGELALIVGLAPIGIGALLESVNVYCQARHLPLLGSLVVRKDTGLPSTKSWGRKWYGSDEGVKRHQKKCFAKWRRA